MNPDDTPIGSASPLPAARLADDAPPITTEELAARWHMQRETLDMWRQRGQGPKWFKLGEGKRARVLYRMEDVKEYEESRRQSSTRAQ